MAVKPFKIINEEWNLEQYATTFVAQIVRRSNAVAGNVIMIAHVPPIITSVTDFICNSITSTSIFYEYFAIILFARIWYE